MSCCLLLVVTSHFLKSSLCIHNSVVHSVLMAERENTVLFSSCCFCVLYWKAKFSEPLLCPCAGPGGRERVCAGHGAARGAANHQHVRWDCHRSAPATARGWALWWLVEDKVGRTSLATNVSLPCLKNWCDLDFVLLLRKVQRPPVKQNQVSLLSMMPYSTWICKDLPGWIRFPTTCRAFMLDY